MGSSCHVGHDGPNSGCCIVKCKKLRKPSLTSPTENQPRRARKNFFWNFFVESTRTQPEATDRHRQSPLRVHSNSPKNRRFAAGGSVHRPFSSGSVSCVRVQFEGSLFGFRPKIKFSPLSTTWWSSVVPPDLLLVLHAMLADRHEPLIGRGCARSRFHRSKHGRSKPWSSSVPFGTVLPAVVCCSK